METLNPSSSCFTNPGGELLLSSQILSSSSSEWSKEENKLFEKALAIYDKETPDRWWNIANMAGRSMEDVIAKYRELLHDVTDIEAGRFPLPFNAFDNNNNNNNGSISISSSRDYDYGYRKKPSSSAAAGAGSVVRGGGGSSDQEIRKKGVPWTEDEHRRFLKGLIKYGKGDWRNISRNFVFTKTPTQVASHAQKYFIRQQQQQQLCESKDHNNNNNKRRPSIHDITTNNLMSTQYNNNNNTIFDHHLKTPLQQSPPNYNYNYWPSSSSAAGWNWLEERALRIFRANYQAAAAAAAAAAPNYNDIAAVAAAMQPENVDLHIPSSSSDNTTTLLGIQSTGSFRIYG